MAVKDRNPNGPAVSKRVKISKTQQQMLLISLFSATALSVLVVLMIFFGKYIAFNNKVISAKDGAIVAYEKTIKNVGLCKDTNNDGKFSAGELEKCNPDALDSASMPNTLRYNVMVNMANNADLESVARNSQANCYDADGNELHLEDVLGTDKDIVTKEMDDELDKRMMLEEIEKLNPRDKEIIELRYGINKKEEMTQKDVANLLGISQSYISRIEKKVIKKLKNIIKS